MLLASCWLEYEHVPCNQQPDGASKARQAHGQWAWRSLYRLHLLAIDAKSTCKAHCSAQTSDTLKIADADLQHLDEGNRQVQVDHVAAVQCQGHEEADGHDPCEIISRGHVVLDVHQLEDLHDMILMWHNLLAHSEDHSQCI